MASVEKKARVSMAAPWYADPELRSKMKADILDAIRNGVPW